MQYLTYVNLQNIIVLFPVNSYGSNSELTSFWAMQSCIVTSF